MSLRKFLKEQSFLYLIYNLRNGLWKNGIQVDMGNKILLSGVKVRQKGKNNILHIGDGVRMKNCSINICGNNNVIHIGENCSLYGTVFSMENDNNEIRLGEGSSTTNQVAFSAIEGTKLQIGKDCMLSTDIYISTGDGHSVCDMNGIRTNPSCDISIGDHVWIGTRVSVGKGTLISSNSIVAAGSVCMSLQEKNENVILGGNPAKAVKDAVNWKRERI